MELYERKPYQFSEVRIRNKDFQIKPKTWIFFLFIAVLVSDPSSLWIKVLQDIMKKITKISMKQLWTLFRTVLRRKSPLSTILTTKPHSEVRRPSSLLDRVVDVGASLAEDWDVRADFLDGG